MDIFVTPRPLFKIPFIKICKCLSKMFSRNSDLNKGITIKVGETTIRIALGDIAKVTITDSRRAIVLPVNTSFDDECITDKRSALGSFFLAHFPTEISNVSKKIKCALKNSDHQCKNGTYPPGTTIVMPPPFDRPCTLLITASTTVGKGVGITSDPTSVCECVKNIFAHAADIRLDTIYLPVLGSGHGGLDKYEALLFMVLTIRHYAKNHHLIKNVEVVVWKEDAQQLCDPGKLQFLSILGD